MQVIEGSLGHLHRFSERDMGISEYLHAESCGISSAYGDK